MRWTPASALAALGVMAFAFPAGAHALLRTSEPGAGAVLQRTPQHVTITFTEQPEPKLSIIRVLDSSGRPVDQGPAQAVPGHPLDLAVPVGPLPQGTYTVSWRTVSQVDGHVTGGAFAFGIGIAPSPAQKPQVTAPPPSPAAVAARWAMYVGLSGLLGAAWVWTLALPEPPARSRGYLWGAWGIAVAGVMGLGVAQASDAGVGVGRLLETALGRALLWRAVPLAAAGLGIAATAPPVRLERGGMAAVGLGSAAAILAHVLAGHAGAAAGPWRWPNVAVQWAHVCAVGVWVGGLAALLFGVRGAPDAQKGAAVRRFSSVAGIAIAVVAAAGVLRSIDEVGSWNALLATAFGHFVLYKSALLLALAALGARNRFWNVPQASRSLAGLRRVGGAELVVAGIVFVLAAVLTGLAPPSLSGQAAPSSQPLVASGSDFATSVRVRLEIAPGLPGPNRFVAQIADYDTGRPIAADRVTLRFAKPDRPDIGQSVLALGRTAAGTYEAQGTNLSLNGEWTIVAVVERGLNSVEVPMTVATRIRALAVRTIEAPGQPTLYGIDLPAGRVLDVYLDPGRPGFNEVHATFIEASGQELPIPRPITITAARPGGAPQALPVRRFGPGHFIGDAQLGPGEWQLEFAGTDAGGTVLEAPLTVRLR